MFLAQSAPILRRYTNVGLRKALRQHSAFSSVSAAALQKKIDHFRRDIETHLPSDGKKVVFATAWLATDNVFVALMKDHFPEMLEGLNLVAIDTMHLFPETLICAQQVQDKYGKRGLWKLPADVKTLEEFQLQYGDCEQMDSADFDFVSKVEPFQRALAECQKDILITGRRMDQANQRISLDVWEDGKRTLNPMAPFSWDDITAYVNKYDVPVNAGHNFAYRCDAPIPATERHLPGLPWKKVDLGKPFWRASEAELKGNPSANTTYVFKSFGDMHTTVPVEPHESERAGRFVRLAKTECGIHTRTTSAGSPHGGNLVDLMVKESGKAQQLVKSTVRTIDINERQACDVFCLLHGAFSPLTGFMEEMHTQTLSTGCGCLRSRSLDSQLRLTFQISQASHKTTRYSFAGTERMLQFWKHRRFTNQTRLQKLKRFTVPRAWSTQPYIRLLRSKESTTSGDRFMAFPVHSSGTQ